MAASVRANNVFTQSGKRDRFGEDLLRANNNIMFALVRAKAFPCAQNQEKKEKHLVRIAIRLSCCCFSLPSIAVMVAVRFV